MEHSKNPINNNPNNNNQAENSASSSGTNSMEKCIIELAEKEVKRTEYKSKYLEIWNDFAKGKITPDQFLTQSKKLRQHYQNFFTSRELLELLTKLQEETKLNLDSDSDSEESENGYWEEASDQEAAEAEWQKEQARRQAEFEAVLERGKEQEKAVAELETSGEMISKIRKKQQQQLQELEAKSKAIENQEKALEVAIKNKAVSVENKEIIKAEISQELTAIKENFENIEIDEISNEELTNKVYEAVTLARMEMRMETRNLFAFDYPLYSSKLEQRAEKIISKKISKLSANLNKKKELAITKTNALIKARNQEVELTQRAILHMEEIIEKQKNDYGRLENQKNEEISELQKSIEELNTRLKKYEKTKEELRTFAEKQASGGKITPKATMKNDEEVKAELIKELNDMRLALIIANKAWDSEKLEKEQAEAKLERETARLKNIISDKEQEIEEIKTTWQKVYNLEKEHKENAQRELKILLDKQVAESGEKIDLEAKNTDLRNKNTRLKTENRELKQKVEAAKPSWIYRACETVGLVSLKNTAVNIILLLGLLAVIYAFSLVLKYIAKPAWLNLAGFFPKTKKRKVITVEAEQEEEEEEAEEEIFEVEPEAVKTRASQPKSVKNSLLITKKPRKKKVNS